METKITKKTLEEFKLKAFSEDNKIIYGLKNGKFVSIILEND